MTSVSIPVFDKKNHTVRLLKSFRTIAESFYNVNYYVKSSSDNLSNENIKTGVSREMIFQK